MEISRKELETVMKLPKSASLINKYKKIWKVCTGRSFDECLCGNGFKRLYTICKACSQDKNKLDKIYGEEK